MVKVFNLVANNREKKTGKFRVAILGAGGISEVHAEVLRGISDIDLAAVCDTQFNKAEAFRDKMGLPAAYPDLETMLGELRPDVVHLAVSPVAHAPTALTCLGAGVHVFVEKPFCVSSADCEQVAYAASRSRAEVGVNHNLVFHPAVARVTQAIRDGQLGGIEHVTIAFNIPMPELPWGPYNHWLFQNSQNVLFELGVHPLSLVYRLLGPVVEAQTLRSGEKVLPSGVRFYSTWQISLKCERGTADVLLSLSAGFEDMWLHVQAEDGACHADIRRNTVFISEKSPLLQPRDDLRDALQTAWGIAGDGVRHYKNYVLASLRRKAPYPLQFAAMDASIRAFYDALRNGATPPMSVAQGTAVVQACESVLAGVMDDGPETPRYQQVMANG